MDTQPLEIEDTPIAGETLWADYIRQAATVPVLYPVSVSNPVPGQNAVTIRDSWLYYEHEMAVTCFQAHHMKVEKIKRMRVANDLPVPNEPNYVHGREKESGKLCKGTKYYNYRLSPFFCVF